MRLVYQSCSIVLKEPKSIVFHAIWLTDTDCDRYLANPLDIAPSGLSLNLETEIICRIVATVSPEEVYR